MEPGPKPQPNLPSFWGRWVIKQGVWGAGGCQCSGKHATSNFWLLADFPMGTQGHHGARVSLMLGDKGVGARCRPRPSPRLAFLSTYPLTESSLKAPVPSPPRVGAGGLSCALE